MCVNPLNALQSSKSNKVLTVENEDPEIGSNITQQDDADLDTQKWILKIYTESIYAIVSKCNNLYINLDNTQNGQKLELREQNDLSSQKFILVNETPKISGNELKDGIY